MNLILCVPGLELSLVINEVKQHGQGSQLSPHVTNFKIGKINNNTEIPRIELQIFCHNKTSLYAFINLHTNSNRCNS